MNFVHPKLSSAVGDKFIAVYMFSYVTFARYKTGKL